MTERPSTPVSTPKVTRTRGDAAEPRSFATLVAHDDLGGHANPRERRRQAFALVMGQRSVVELTKSVNEANVSAIASLPAVPLESRSCAVDRQAVPKATKSRCPSHWTRQTWSIGVKRGEAGNRWRFLQGNEYYLTQAGRTIDPSVVIETTPSRLPESFPTPHLLGP